MIALAFDPATTTGWAIVEDQHLVASGKCPHADAIGEAYRALERHCAPRGYDAPPDIVAIELAYIPMGDAGRAASAASVYWRGGYLEGASHALWPTATIWTPNASSWRAKLGLGGKNRKAKKEMAKAWVKATFGIDVGADEADAVGLAVAAIGEMRRRAA
jgi:Holliday junction resolvasome RuvABC endonuclease subunit